MHLSCYDFVFLSLQLLSQLRYDAVSFKKDATSIGGENKQRNLASMAETTGKTKTRTSRERSATAPQKTVTIYTDGACLGNPGPGGWGVVLLYGEHRRELSGGYRLTTNNRMEILAAIKGLEALKSRCSVTLYSDSQYLVNAISKSWAKRWQANGWKRNARERALNPDLWERLLNLCSRHEVTFVWVRGHANNRENERCDILSKEAAARPALEADPGYPGISPEV